VLPAGAGPVLGGPKPGGSSSNGWEVAATTTGTVYAYAICAK
jgi:hypothetical protein